MILESAVGMERCTQPDTSAAGSGTAAAPFDGSLWTWSGVCPNLATADLLELETVFPL
jgi:hypothetical protein